MNQLTDKLKPGVMILLGGGLLAYFAVGTSSGTNSRPAEYKTVSIAQAENSKGYVQMSGKAQGRLKTEYGEVNLNLSLKKDDSSIECQSSELRGNFSFPVLANGLNQNKILQAYEALVKSGINNEEVTVKGKIKDKKLEMYELSIGDKNYILLDR
jgi:hypothetical protein